MILLIFNRLKLIAPLEVHIGGGWDVVMLMRFTNFFIFHEQRKINNTFTILSTFSITIHGTSLNHNSQQNS